MSKFKVGDKITPVVIKCMERVHPYLVERSVYTVVRVEFDLLDIVGTPSADVADRGALNYWCCDWSEEHFKLVEENEEMTAEQIRNEILRIDVRIEEAKKDIENAENERNSLVGKLREKGFELSEQRLQKGDKAKIIDNTSSHHFPIGKEVKVSVAYDNYYVCVDTDGSRGAVATMM